jgi:hypothetical protein
MVVPSRDGWWANGASAARSAYATPVRMFRIAVPTSAALEMSNGRDPVSGLIALEFSLRRQAENGIRRAI